MALRALFAPSTAVTMEPRDPLMKEYARVRILVVSPPRSENHWVECLLGRIYELNRVGGAKKPREMV